MACNRPLAAFLPVAGGSPIFKPSLEHPGRYSPIKLPCGQCTGCRLEKSRQWAMRCVHEAQTHSRNCFVTLTYADEHLPQYGSLSRAHLTKFFKRLRDHKGPFRYYACGEYGDQTQRAHYHACLFGVDFDDKIEFRQIGEHKLYISEQLTKIWGHGNASIGSLTFETAAYTARYVMKKQTGKTAKPFTWLDPETGELQTLTQPFAVMSLRKAIGKTWLIGNTNFLKPDQHGPPAPVQGGFYQDIYSKDAIVLRGKKMPPARYYDKLYDKINPQHLKKLKQKRIENSNKLTDNQLRAREQNACAALISRKQV